MRAATLQRALDDMIVDNDEPIVELYELVERLSDTPTEVRTLVAFVEAHPEIYFGTPGPVVHWLEHSKHQQVYRDQVAASFQENPGSSSLCWMFSRQYFDMLRRRPNDPETHAWIGVLEKVCGRQDLEPWFVDELFERFTAELRSPERRRAP